MALNIIVLNRKGQRTVLNVVQQPIRTDRRPSPMLCCADPRLAPSRSPPSGLSSLNNSTQSTQSILPKMMPGSAPAPPRDLTFAQKIQYHLLAPENIPGNISIVIASTVFAGSIYAFNTWGKWLAV
ncbi:hypothetical protein BCR44DRAFT_1010767 [Catenaria anguillulae PL171]|uniref:Uncharacterized protein n=1 Tax=Catenaria anguillulae PL171 TaxID=765915 RepID=A0A1Y2I428_9FUNG|nr:hypothetical protein BCR44DRAFT_1010767 [Catenaria anguillulae PL171]